MSTNIKAFPVDYSKKSTLLFDDLKVVLDRHLGTDKYLAQITAVSTPVLEGVASCPEAEFVSYRFNISPPDIKEEDTDILLGVLLENIAKDPIVARAVASKYAHRLIDVITSLIEHEEEEE